MKTGKEMAADVFTEIELRQNVMNGKRKIPAIKTAIVTVVLLALLTCGAFAVIHFTLPKGLEESVGNGLKNILIVTDDGSVAEGVEVVDKSVESKDYIITFEAIAEGENIRTVFTKNIGDTEFTAFEKQDLYAIISIKNKEGESVSPEYAAELAYVVCVEGYAPYQAMFEDYAMGYCTDEDGTLYAACMITDAKVLANDNLYIALFENWPVSGDTLRMNEKGKPVYTDTYEGIKAIFDLPIPEKYADDVAAAELKNSENFIANPDYSSEE